MIGHDITAGGSAAIDPLGGILHNGAVILGQVLVKPLRAAQFLLDLLSFRNVHTGGETADKAAAAVVERLGRQGQMPLFAVPAPADYFIGLFFPPAPAGKFFLKNPEAVFIEE